MELCRLARCLVEAGSNLSHSMKSPSLRLVLILTSAALGISGCIKQPIRTATSAMPTGLIGNQSPISEDFAATKVGDIQIPDRGNGVETSRLDRAALQDHAILFDYDKSDIAPTERGKLKWVKAYLDTHPGHKLILEGYCDWRGTAEYNLSLGDRRASATKKYLESIGVSPQRLETLSKGSMEAPRNADATAMKKDRRVELVVVN
jgi:peptidoglycan-associated lipoprotein